VRGLLVKLLRRVRRGELWCGDRGANTGESDVCAGMSTDSDLLELVAASRNDDNDSLGDVDALDEAEECC
jgi:hypothetical protein